MIICLVAVVVVMIMWTPYLRDVIGRHIGSVSSKNAIDRTTQAVKTAYPNENITWISGAYYNVQGKWDDFCYTSDYMVNELSDNVITATYCDSDSQGIWKDQSTIHIAKKEYDRKIALIKRLSKDYTRNLIKTSDEKINSLLQLPYKMSITTPYVMVDYDKELPASLSYGMDFNQDIALDWEYQIIIRDYKQNTYDQTIRDIVTILDEYDYKLHAYHFVFVNDVNEAVYFYDITKEVLSKGNLDLLYAEGQLNAGKYQPYGDETRYFNK